MTLQWKREEAQLKQTHEETLEQLREEKTHLNDEFAKIRHKSKVSANSKRWGILSRWFSQQFLY